MIKNFRQCNALAWNPKDKNLFAAGYEYVNFLLMIILQSKNESSLFIWDINRSVDPSYNIMREAELYPNSNITSSSIGKLE